MINIASSSELVKCVKANMDSDDSELSEKEKLKKGFNKCVRELGIKRDLEIIGDFIEDVIPVKGHYRTINGKRVWVEESKRKGEKKREVLAKVERLKASEKEAAIQKKIEKTGYERERAEVAVEAKLRKQKGLPSLEEEKAKKEETIKEITTEKQIQLNQAMQSLQKFGTKRTMIRVLKPFIRLIIEAMKGNEITGERIFNAIEKVRSNRKIDARKKDAIVRKMERLSKSLSKLKKRDFFITDTFDELIAWVWKHLNPKDEEDAKQIALFIWNKRKKSKGKDKKVLSEKEKKKAIEEEWEEIKRIAKEYQKSKGRYKQYKKGQKIQSQRSIYGSKDMYRKDITLTELLGRITHPFKRLLKKKPKEEEEEGLLLYNTETKEYIKGELLKGENYTALTPVSSSTVKGVGVFNNELIVQFYPSKKIPQRTYRYAMQSIEAAEEAHVSLLETPSPGRWIWANVRGHEKGEATGINIVPEKYGPSLSPPGTGKQVIGGTTASLIKPYSISNRVPVPRMPKFDEAIKKLKRSKPSPVKDPQTGSRIETLLQLRKALRKPPKVKHPKELEREARFGAIEEIRTALKEVMPTA